MTNLTRKAIYRRDAFECVTCGSTVGLQVHHFVPRGRGGQDNEENLVTLCWKCHAVCHGTRIPELPDYINPEWMECHIAEYLAELYVCQTDEPWHPLTDETIPRSPDLDAWVSDDMTKERSEYLAQRGLRQVTIPGV